MGESKYSCVLLLLLICQKGKLEVETGVLGDEVLIIKTKPAFQCYKKFFMGNLRQPQVGTTVFSV